MLRLATPIVFAELGWMGMGLVDTIMVGRLPNSATAIGAVSLGTILFYTLAISASGLLLGLDTLVSQAYGAGDLDDCRHSLVNGVILALLMTPALMCAVWMWPLVLAYSGISQPVLRETIPYLNALNWSAPGLLLYFAFRRYLQSIDLVKPVMFVLITANVVNLLGNWMLVYGHLGMPALGTRGSGWATCISRIYMALALGLFILKRQRRFHLSPDWRRVRQLIALGLPAGGQIFVEVGVFALVAALIGKLDAASLAGHQIALNTVSTTFMVPLGIGSAAAVRVGQALGRREPDAAALSGWVALVLGAAFMSTMSVAMTVFPRHIASIFTTDPNVIRAAVTLLFFGAIFQVFDGIQTVATGSLRGAGDTRTPMLCHFVCYWLIGLPIGAYLCFARGWGAAGLWAGLCAALVVIGSLLLWVWRRKTLALRTVKA